MAANGEVHFYERFSNGLAKAGFTKAGKKLLMNAWAWKCIERYFPMS